MTKIKILGSTLRRLQKLKRTNAVWEGDRRVLPKGHVERDNSNLIDISNYLAEAATPQPHCILWVDGSLGMVRAMEVVSPDLGAEAIVRNLLLAMERPQGSAMPSLPQKILVCDRSLQFYLRGVLQDLDIPVEHVDDLPLIDEIFHNILDQGASSPPPVPQEQAGAIYAQTLKLWQLAPWQYMWDHQVIEIVLNHWDIGSFYAVIMGKLGLEKGVVLYRDPNSLLEFRAQIADDDEDDDLEEVFLRQDCFFSLYESTDSLSDSEIRYFRAGGCGLLAHDIYPVFGSVNPLEGGRSHLDQEEAEIMIAALAALNEFFGRHHKSLKSKKLKNLSHTVKVAIADYPHNQGLLSIEVKTLPGLSQQLDPSEAPGDPAKQQIKPDKPFVQQDLFPGNALLKLIDMSWNLVETLRVISPNAFINIDLEKIGDRFLPSLLIQTSRPKALNLIQEIEDQGGISSICFALAENKQGKKLELGLIQMGNGNHQLFGQFANPDPKIKKWKQASDLHQGYCAVLISMGVTGTSRGQLVTEYILGYYEVKLVTTKEVGLGLLLGT